MAWQSLGGRSNSGRNSGAWLSRPCIGIRKDGFTINRPACETLGLMNGSVDILFDPEALKVRILKSENGYLVCGAGGIGTTSLYVRLRLPEALHEFVGSYYAAEMVEGTLEIALNDRLGSSRRWKAVEDK